MIVNLISRVLASLGVLCVVFGGSSLFSEDRSDHICTVLVSQSCKGTGQGRCNMYANQNGHTSCGETNCFYCNNTTAITDAICIYLEGSSCELTSGSIDCSASTTFIAEECSVEEDAEGRKNCSCLDAQRTEEGDGQNKCGSRTMVKCKIPQMDPIQP